MYNFSPRKRKRDKATLLYTGELGAPNPMWKEKLFEEQEINMSVDGGYLPYKMDGLLEGKDNAAFLGDDMTGGDLIFSLFMLLLVGSSL